METLTALTKTTGPCVIMAGAGTGKTHAMVEKLKYLIQNRVYEPEHILALTFSNEAAESLKSRVTRQLKYNEPLVKTFHSFCADLLHANGSKIDIPEEFTILVPDDGKILLHKYFKLNPRLCHTYIETIGRAKDLGITLTSLQSHIEKETKKENVINLEYEIQELQLVVNTSYLKKSLNHKTNKERLKKLTKLLALRKFTQAWNGYEKIKTKKKTLDYADLNQKALELLEKHPALTSQFQYVLVDEFQDTNKMQGDLLVKLCPHRNITIVGDLNQSIYRFRGAYRENIARFKQAFQVKAEDIFSLSKSYRSPNTVLRVAHQLIEHNYRNKVDCFEVTNAFNREGTPIEVYEMLNEKEETRKILEFIQQAQADNKPLEELCVMFRTHQQASSLKRALTEKKVPFTSVTKNPLLATPSVRTLINYLVITYKRHVKKKGGEQTWWDLFHQQAFSSEDLAEIGSFLKKNQDAPCISELMYETLENLDLSDEGKRQARAIKANLKELQDHHNKPLIEIIEKAKNFSLQEEKANLECFITKAKEYIAQESDQLEEFLYHLEIMQKLGIGMEAPALEQRGVRIMTHHATKGLEYEIVICAGMVQQKFPGERMRSSSLLPLEIMPDLAEQLADTPDYLHEELIEDYERDSHLTEERRLCYVAFTRAKERLVITYAREYGGKASAPSCFLSEIKYTTNPDIVFSQDNTISEKNQQLITKSGLKPRRKSTFSPSALLLFNECQKKYEYKYLFHMPEKEPTSWEELKLGSFVHYIIDQGITSGSTSEKTFADLARAAFTNPEWNTINLDDALSLLRVFFQRNKHKYTPSSLTEIKLRTTIEGITFEGYADRIDVHPEGLEIIDYKTGKTPLSVQHRNWQLGIYALAAPNLGKGPVKRLTLDMLRHEKPYEFELQQNGIAKEINSRVSFDLNQVKLELVKTAQHIMACYEQGFEPCSLEKNCEFCNEYIWKV